MAADSPSLTLDDLTNLFDDIDTVDHDDSPENTGVPTLAPPPAGKYGVQLVAFDVDRNQDGTVRNKHRFVCDFKIVDPPADAAFMQDRKVRFIRVTGESRKRTVNGVQRSYVELFDLVHAYDPSFACNGSLGTASQFLLERIAESAICYIQLDWKAWDTKHWQAQSGDSLSEGDAKKQLYKECGIRGQRKFGHDGTFLNPASGNLLKAQPFMKWAYIPKVTSPSA